MRIRLAATPLVTLAILTALAVPPIAAAASPTAEEPYAVLAGTRIDLARVGTLHCHDFRWPEIECFATARDLETNASAVLAAAAVDYVRIFENTSFGGVSMYVSQDYSVLVLIGWNDRISSFKALNSETGSFYTDWFYGGTRYGFCCDQSVATLGSFDNTFSSMQRT